jgi:hypothetical protein
MAPGCGSDRVTGLSCPGPGAIIDAVQPSCEADVVSDFDFGTRGDAPEGGSESLRRTEDVIDRAQRLIDSPRPYDGYPLEWHFEALNVGDLTAIASVALRSSSPESVSDSD